MVSPSTLETAGDRPTLAELEPLARAALAQYGIAPRDLHNQRYYNNATYRVVAADGRQYVLRVTSNHHGEERLRSEMQWLRAMQGDADLRVPDPVATLDGRFVVQASAPAVPEPRWCNVFRWRDGTLIAEERMSAADFGRMGAAGAHLHRRSVAFVPPAGFDRPRWDEEFCLDPGVDSTYQCILAHLRRHFPPDAVGRFAQLVDEGRALMTRLHTDPQSHGLVHADLHAGNFLFQPDGVAFIDFEDLGWGYFGYDVATALFGSIERPDYPTITQAFTSAYAGVRPLPPDFDRQLVCFQVLRSVFLTHLVVARGDLAESVWWEGYVVGKLRRLLG